MVPQWWMLVDSGSVRWDAGYWYKQRLYIAITGQRISTVYHRLGTRCEIARCAGMRDIIL